MEEYEKYVELKILSKLLNIHKRQAEDEASKKDIDTRIEENNKELQSCLSKLKQEGCEMCSCCGEPLSPEDGRCYNDACEEYDPFGQYFD